MTRFVRVCLVACVISNFVTGTAVAQDEGGKPKSLENDYLVGLWRVEGNVEGDQLKGMMRVRTGADNTCLILNWRLRGENKTLTGTAVAGYDPKTDRFAEYCFESDGSHFVNRYETKDDPSTLGIGHGKRTGIVSGKEYEGDITVDRRDRDHFVYTVTSAGGEDVKLVFKRAKGAQRKKGK